MFKFSGDPNKNRLLIARARQMEEFLKSQLKHSGLFFSSKRLDLPDGSFINITVTKDPIYSTLYNSISHIFSPYTNRIIEEPPFKYYVCHRYPVNNVNHVFTSSTPKNLPISENSGGTFTWVSTKLKKTVTWKSTAIYINGKRLPPVSLGLNLVTNAVVLGSRLLVVGETTVLSLKRYRSVLVDITNFNSPSVINGITYSQAQTSFPPEVVTYRPSDEVLSGWNITTSQPEFSINYITLDEGRVLLSSIPIFNGEGATIVETSSKINTPAAHLGFPDNITYTRTRTTSTPSDGGILGIASSRDTKITFPLKITNQTLTHNISTSYTQTGDTVGSIFFPTGSTGSYIESFNETVTSVNKVVGFNKEGIVGDVIIIPNDTTTTTTSFTKNFSYQLTLIPTDIIGEDGNIIVGGGLTVVPVISQTSLLSSTSNVFKVSVVYSDIDKELVIYTTSRTVTTISQSTSGSLGNGTITIVTEKSSSLDMYYKGETTTIGSASSNTTQTFSASTNLVGSGGLYGSNPIYGSFNNGIPSLINSTTYSLGTTDLTLRLAPGAFDGNRVMFTILSNIVLTGAASSLRRGYMIDFTVEGSPSITTFPDINSNITEYYESITTI